MFGVFYLYPVYLSVTAIRALAKSNGYVNDCDVMPASEPAKNRRPLVLYKQTRRTQRQICILLRILHCVLSLSKCLPLFFINR